MDTNNGAEKLINTIMDEARAAARKTEEDAAAAVAAIKQKLDDDKLALRAEYAERAERVKQDAIARALTNAELESRKELLGRKRGLLDRAFSEAYKRICTLPENERAALLKKLLLAECEGGEVIHPAPKEHMEDIVAEAAKSLPGGLTLGAEDAEIRSGFTVEGRGYYKNCSFTAVLEAAKEACEADVAKTLFD